MDTTLSIEAADNERNANQEEFPKTRLDPEESDVDTTLST